MPLYRRAVLASLNLPPNRMPRDRKCCAHFLIARQGTSYRYYIFCLYVDHQQVFEGWGAFPGPAKNIILPDIRLPIFVTYLPTPQQCDYSQCPLMAAERYEGLIFRVCSQSKQVFVSVTDRTGKKAQEITCCGVAAHVAGQNKKWEINPCPQANGYNCDQKPTAPDCTPNCQGFEVYLIGDVSRYTDIHADLK